MCVFPICLYRKPFICNVYHPHTMRVCMAQCTHLMTFTLMYYQLFTTRTLCECAWLSVHIWWPLFYCTTNCLPPTRYMSVRGSVYMWFDDLYYTVLWEGLNSSKQDEFSVAPVIMKRCWLFSCRQLDSKETYLANVSTGCSSPTLAPRRTGASGRNVSKISFFAIKLSTREQSASFQ